MGKYISNKAAKILNVQKKIVRLITFKSYLEHTDPLFQSLKILNIFKINDYLSCLFMYRFKKQQNLPEFFYGYFTQNNDVHHYNTRNANKLHVNYSRTNYAKHTIVNKGFNIWNSPDQNICNITSYLTFKRKTKELFLKCT